MSQATTQKQSPKKALPKMDSIWLDEDQEEKLYNIQAQVLMDSDENEDELQNIMFLNSKKPLLNNKKNIELPPLTEDNSQRHGEKFAKSGLTSQKRANRRSILKLFTQDKERRPVSISTPFNFQHISHANGFSTAVETRELEREQLQKDLSKRKSLSPTLKEQVLRTPPRVTSKPQFPTTPSSRSSSTKYSASPSASSGVMSDSIMGTSIDETSIEGLDELIDEVDNISLKEFRNYNFPSLIKSTIEQEELPPMAHKPLHASRMANKSQSPSLLDLGSVISEGPEKRISVQDILKFYAGSTRSSFGSNNS
ncbi:septin ring organization [Nakaseomyces bracarensis]|uniref:Septin ring organization n=1 Tax=Nakaseomyces bracarensis TaxID=273131 RepID=A0ABR4P050_9SACH